MHMIKKVLFLLVCNAYSLCMEPEKIVLPNDIGKTIIELAASDNTVKCYPITYTYSDYTLLLPQTAPVEPHVLDIGEVAPSPTLLYSPQNWCGFVDGFILKVNNQPYSFQNCHSPLFIDVKKDEIIPVKKCILCGSNYKGLICDYDGTSYLCPGYSLYTFSHNPNSFGATISIHPTSIKNDTGTLTTLSLEPHQNNVVYCFADLLERAHVVIRDLTSPKSLCTQTPQPFSKIVCLGLNTYLGITSYNDVYSFWVDKHSTIQYAQQKMPKPILNAAVDSQQKTKRGFCHKLVFLAENGDFYFTNLCESKKPTLVYGHSVFKDDSSLERDTDLTNYSLCYDNGTCSLVHPKDSFYVWPDRNDELHAKIILFPKQVESQYA